MLVHHLYAVDSFHFHLYLQVAMFRDVRQNLDEQNLDAHLSYRHEVHPLILQDVVVDAEVHHHLKMDYYLVVVAQDVALVELRLLMKMDYFLDVELVLQESQKLAHLVLALQVVVFVALQFVQGVLLFLLALL